MQPPRPLSILYVAYPLLAVSEESAGGAEQMLLTLERKVGDMGHRTAVAAANGSQVNGRLLSTGDAANAPDQFAQREHEHHVTILNFLHNHPAEFDLIHDESASFFRMAAECPVPVLATLHLPRSFYPADAFLETPPNLYFNCVSQSQQQSFRDLPLIPNSVQNGIAIDRFPFSPIKGDYLLWLGRICEEKAPHLAIAAAQRASLPLIIAGQVYPFSYHRDYFERAVRPHLGAESNVQFIDSPSLDQKIELLCRARALLLTSAVEETSSLVALEAMACGTPVVGFPRGAVPEIVTDVETGFLVDSVAEMAAALKRVKSIAPQACRARVEQYFTADRMAREYVALYREVLANSAHHAAA